MKGKEPKEPLEETGRTAPPPKDQQDLRQARGHDPDAAERGRPESDIPDAPRDMPPQEPPD
ncbi:hypothetical protein [Actinacidiphila sp. bgisy160]|uniref:hypothetical protein n=1 Tax=Actinacidiphila sp. bgisy160 TaxID=3413796 RepID=UPI003D72D299